MIFDCHNHIGYDPVYQQSRSADELSVEMSDNGVSNALIFPFTNNPDIINQNKIILEALRKYPHLQEHTLYLGILSYKDFPPRVYL